MDFAVRVDDDVIARIAAGEKIALAFERVDEGGAVGCGRPAAGDFGHAYLFGDAGALLLLLLAEIFLRGALVEAVPAAVLCIARLHAVRQFQPVVAREFLRDGAQLQPVV